MIQFNLLPDVKIQYIKTQRLKHILILVSVLASVASVAILLFSVSFAGLQKNHLSNLDEDINRLSAELEGNSELTKILSVQNQLNTLPSLYYGRPAVDRLPGYIDQTTPQSASISRLNIDFSTSAIEIAGQADSLESVNSYVDTLKYTTYVEGESSTAAPAFSNVVLSQFGKDKDAASFVIAFNFDPIIFDISRSVTLTVPNLVTTRAKGSPTQLFDDSGAQAEQEGAQDGGQ